jgi:hypothetical protein
MEGIDQANVQQDSESLRAAADMEDLISKLNSQFAKDQPGLPLEYGPSAVRKRMQLLLGAEVFERCMNLHADLRLLMFARPEFKVGLVEHQQFGLNTATLIRTGVHRATIAPAAAAYDEVQLFQADGSTNYSLDVLFENGTAAVIYLEFGADVERRPVGVGASIVRTYYNEIAATSTVRIFDAITGGAAVAGPVYAEIIGGALVNMDGVDLSAIKYQLSQRVEVRTLLGDSPSGIGQWGGGDVWQEVVSALVTNTSARSDFVKCMNSTFEKELGVTGYNAFQVEWIYPQFWFTRDALGHPDLAVSSVAKLESLYSLYHSVLTSFLKSIAIDPNTQRTLIAPSYH